MDVLPADLPSALTESRERLQTIGRAVALRHTGLAAAGASGDAAMALAGREAIFADAVLGAIKARIAELRAVTK